MNDQEAQEAQRMRDAITRDQTACRCGHLLAACADCRDWLSENALRITNEWHLWMQTYSGDHTEAFVRILNRTRVDVDAAEADDLDYFEAGR